MTERNRRGLLAGAGASDHASALSSTGSNRTYFFSGMVDPSRKYGSHPPKTGADAMGHRLPR